MPVALATDDEGVARSDMTHEWLRAVETYNLSYAELKRMARDSLDHSFLPGESLWVDGKQRRAIPACAGDHPGSKPSDGCRKFLELHERARLQWKLEEESDTFEKKF